ncbi:hypothetical protein WR25_16713 [Diploscapter pachys]|uniref:Nicotinamide phosphoribosyltransferase n=1 Tax=Diploscapter pachys TaxID=2018661 RepID=A0A2A2LUM4_9BILA|nr:hypothetical protein WR25_16713 [Diploscapter pachys]
MRMDNARKAEEARQRLGLSNGDQRSFYQKQCQAWIPSTVFSIWLTPTRQITHHLQYPSGTTHVYSYFESRGGKFDSVCFFGLQYILKKWLTGQVVDRKAVQEAKEFYRLHFGNLDLFNEEDWNYICDKHNGHLPLRIKAVPEGTVLPIRNVLFTVENTDPNVPWLTNWFETVLVQCWYPMTVCTNSRAQKEIIARYLLETAGSLDGLPFKLHDFGFRGSTSSAGIGGAAHLVNFGGTDTIAAVQVCKKYYNCPMAGSSVPASEHSTITTWDRNGEIAAYRNMLEKFPDGIVSVVSDSYDVYQAVSQIWGKELRDKIFERGNNDATLILKLLEESFPVTINELGYKVLPDYIRILQGDGISLDTLDNVLRSIKDAGWSTENVAFGTGGALLQKLDRDTQKCAFKCSHVTINGESRDVFKNPATDASKKSKRGRLILRQKDGVFETIQEGMGDPDEDKLVTVFENGKLLVDYSLEEIKERAELEIVKQNRSKAAQNGHV